MSREGLRILEKRAVGRIRVHQQGGVRQVLGQPVRVAHRNHLVVEALHDQCGVTQASQVREALAGEALPLAERGNLRLATFGPEGGSRSSFRCISLAMNASPAAWLVRVGVKKIFSRRRSRVPRILEVLGEARFFEVHDVLAAARRRTDEDHPTKDRRPVLRDLLGDHAAEREPEDVARCRCRGRRERP